MAVIFFQILIMLGWCSIGKYFCLIQIEIDWKPLLVSNLMNFITNYST